MNLTYLVETDWAVHWLRGRRQIIDIIQQLQPQGLGLSIISLAELYTGIYRSSNPLVTKQGLKDFLTLVTILDVNEYICQIFGKENARLRKEGQIIEDFDLMIATTCLYHNLKLLTNNRQHFERIEGLQIVSIAI
jgi:predicted nucleic acid-binding protein